MNQKIRFAIVFLLLAGILLLAKNQVFGAAEPMSGQDENLQPESQAIRSDEAANPGTIHPPGGEVVITTSGTYRVGGFCSYTVEFLVTDISVHVSLERPLPRPLPDKVHAVRQGCRVTYYQRPDGTRIDEFTAEMGTSSICFAATPGQDNKVYFLNIYAADPVWGPAEGTTSGSGGPCSDAGRSGVYVGTFETP